MTPTANIPQLSDRSDREKELLAAAKEEIRQLFIVFCESLQRKGRA